MMKNSFIYIILIAFVSLTVWFFINKTNTEQNGEGFEALIKEQQPEERPEEPEEIVEEKNVTGEFVTLPSGLQVQDVSIGTGREAQNGDIVAAHYTGTLEDGTKFDSSYDRDQPFAFILGGGMVIKGWDIGIAGMKVGGKRKLIIPPDLAYGDREVSALIPASSTLYFDIELVAVQTPEIEK